MFRVGVGARNMVDQAERIYFDRFGEKIPWKLFIKDFVVNEVLTKARARMLLNYINELQQPLRPIAPFGSVNY